MEEALKCVRCNDFAKDALSSTCECSLLYCSDCAKLTNQCHICNKTLYSESSNN